MRLMSYAVDGVDRRAGIELDGRVADAAEAARLAGWVGTDAADRVGGMRALLALGGGRLGELAEVAAACGEQLREAGALHALDAVRIGPPVPDPQKLICLGLNYADHAAEAGLAPPEAPMFFAKFANSLTGPTDPIVVPAPAGAKVDYEAELAVVIGRRAHGVAPEDALGYVAGVMALNDVSARDLQLSNQLWTRGKAIDTFAPCGPALVTRDELGDLQALAVRTRVNGETVQDGSTAEMIFGVAETVAFLSQTMTLEPGDVIATGTPAGVGQSRTPPLFLADGDVVEVEIEGVGRLRNAVRSAGN